MNSLELNKPQPPKNGFTGTSGGTNNDSNHNGLQRGRSRKHSNINLAIDQELRSYSLNEIEVLARDLLEMVSNSRRQNRVDHGILVSASILVQMLIRAGVQSAVLRPDQIVHLPRSSMGINFKPLKRPVQELMAILGILIRLLFDEARLRAPELTRVDAIITNSDTTDPITVDFNLERCLALIEQEKDSWRIQFDVEDFHTRVNGFFSSRETPRKSYSISS
jgi:hypothetical protein